MKLYLLKFWSTNSKREEYHSRKVFKDTDSLISFLRDRIDSILSLSEYEINRRYNGEFWINFNLDLIDSDSLSIKRIYYYSQCRVLSWFPLSDKKKDYLYSHILDLHGEESTLREFLDPSSPHITPSDIVLNCGSN